MLFVFGLIRTCKALPNFAQRCGHLRGQSALLSENRKPPAYRATLLYSSRSQTPAVAPLDLIEITWPLDSLP